MRAGRPRGFCVEDALDRAMTVFWRHGYEGASLSELTAAMGINSPSLYACFGNKEGLFRAVLERYDGRRKSFMDYVMAAPDVGQMAERFLHGVDLQCGCSEAQPLRGHAASRLAWNTRPRIALSSSFPTTIFSSMH